MVFCCPLDLVDLEREAGPNLVKANSKFTALHLASLFIPFSLGKCFGISNSPSSLFQTNAKPCSVLNKPQL